MITNSGHADAIRVLLGAGTDLNVADTSGFNPFMDACICVSPNTPYIPLLKYFRSHEGCRRLLKAGANTTYTDEKHYNALHFAVEGDQEKLTDVLVSTAPTRLIHRNYTIRVTPPFFLFHPHLDSRESLHAHCLRERSNPPPTTTGIDSRCPHNISTTAGHDPKARILVDEGIHAGVEGLAVMHTTFRIALSLTCEQERFMFFFAGRGKGYNLRVGCAAAAVDC